MSTPPRRLIDTADATPEERLLASHFRAVSEPGRLPSETVERIAHRVERSVRRRAFGGRPFLWFLIFGTPLAFAGVWSAKEVLAPERSAKVRRSSPRPPRAVETAALPPPADLRAPVELASPVPAETTPPAPVVAERPARRPRREAVPSIEAATPVAEAPSLAEPPPPAPVAVELEEEDELDALAEESALIRKALEQLRTRGDANAALTSLDEHRRRFADGQLQAEAAIARVDALLVLGRHADALSELQSLPSNRRAQLPRRTELEVLEAELLARVDRCEDAAQMLRGRTYGDARLEQRALFIRGTCAARANRFPEARAAFEELLRRWPESPLAREARRALGETP